MFLSASSIDRARLKISSLPHEEDVSGTRNDRVWFSLPEDVGIQHVNTDEVSTFIINDILFLSEGILNNARFLRYLTGSSVKPFRGRCS